MLSIQNSGTIISDDDLPHIFEPFYRGENATNTKKIGAGLGLAIVYEIAKIHGAKINVESSPKKGTIFSVQFKTI